MNATLKLKDRKIDNHIKHFAKSGDIVEVIRYLSASWVTIQISNNHTWVIDVPADVLELKKCIECKDFRTINTISVCTKCGSSE